MLIQCGWPLTIESTLDSHWTCIVPCLSKKSGLRTPKMHPTMTGTVHKYIFQFWLLLTNIFRGTHHFMIEMSPDQATWTMIVNSSLASVVNLPCENILIHDFTPIVEAVGPYLRFTVLSYHVWGAGLQYFDYEFVWFDQYLVSLHIKILYTLISTLIYVVSVFILTVVFTFHTFNVLNKFFKLTYFHTLFSLW